MRSEFSRSPTRSPRLPSALLLAFAILHVSCGGVTTPLQKGTTSVSERRVAHHVAYLASDELKGRDTPSPGLDSAAAYIARTFASAGLLPVRGSHYQDVHLHTVALGDTNSLLVRKAGDDTWFALKDDFVPFDMTADREVSGALAFAGYGITAPEYGYDDYSGIDVRGAIVLVLRHEPGEDDSASVFRGRKATDYSNVSTKVRIAREHGAIGLIVVTDPLNHTSLTPRGFPWPSLSRLIPRDALPLTMAVENSAKIPVVHAGEKVIRSLFDSVDSLKQIQAAIDESVEPHSFLFRNVVVTLRTSTHITDHLTHNVVGFLPGLSADSGIVIVGAHYDHVGYRKNAPSGSDSIYNGADDNASGTAALLEVAAGLGAIPVRPARSILLIAFAGEEKGLFGSTHYVHRPLFPLTQTTAMLNMDMVGRNAPDSLLLIADDRDSLLLRVTYEENGAVGLGLRRTTLDAGGSDHLSFARAGVPALFYHSGLHADYHTVSDEADRINPAKIARVVQLVMRTAWHLADTPTPHLP